MRSAILIAALAFGASFAAGFVSVPTARCAWCPSYKCYGRGMCGQGCVCLSEPGKTYGYCYGVEGGAK